MRRTKDRKPKNQFSRLNPGHAEARASRLHDQIREFEDFRENILPAIQKDIKSGLTAKQIREKYSALVQGRAISDAIRTTDPKEAAPIIKDVLDRVEGKATEKKEVTHRFKDMSDNELDALLESEKGSLAELEDRFEQ